MVKKISLKTKIDNKIPFHFPCYLLNDTWLALHVSIFEKIVNPLLYDTFEVPRLREALILSIRQIT